MAKKKICKSCRIFYDEGTCPICKGTTTATSFQGRIFVVNPETSPIAQKMGVKNKGEYALKVR